MVSRRLASVRAGGDRACAVLGLIGAALYLYLLTEVAIGDVDRHVSFVSELSARDQPHHLLFQAFDVSAGAFIVALGLGLSRGTPTGRVRTPGSLCVLGFGLATASVGLLPLDCAPSASRACSLNEQFGRVSLVHHLHTVASVLSTMTVIASLALLGWASRARPGWRPVAWFAAVALPVVSVLSTTLAVLGLGWGLDESTTAAAHVRALLGVGQRVELLIVAGWITVLSFCLLKAGQTSTMTSHGNEDSR
jgi:hypothetical protein